ncbi:MAG TPA: hypothetical protein VHT96_11600 [Clostridia bacterium]|nr:hypothetical protein [Clostridia bacterium]
MKKVIALIMSLAMLAVIFSGCGSAAGTPSGEAATTVSGEAAATAPAESAATAESTAAAPASGDALKTGLGVVISLAKSADAGDKDGLAETDAMVAAVLVDGAGKIVNCRIDAAQTKINFSKEGKLTTAKDAAFKTKQELGTEYGMGKASKIGKEWNEQADAFATYVTGKTVDEVKGIAVSAEGVATAADLTSSVTVHIGDFIAAVEKAVNNAQDLGAKTGDKLGLGISTSMGQSADFTADAAGLAQAYSYYTASTFGADGKVTSCVIDASQGNVNFDATGKITSDIKAAAQTKDEIKEGYGMKKASKIGKEWYEQAAAFAKYATGKSIDEVKGIAVDQGVATAADLTSSVTIHIGDFQKVIEKASANAK